jgi:hypothetical protein
MLGFEGSGIALANDIRATDCAEDLAILPAQNAPAEETCAQARGNDFAILPTWKAPRKAACANVCGTLNTWEVMIHLPWP